MRMGRFTIGLALLVACTGFAFAGGRSEVRKQTELSMLFTGTIEIAQDGTVRGHSIDNAEKLPAVAVRLMDKVARQWKFEPVVIDGRPVVAHTAMSVRLVATRVEGRDDFNVRVAAANFGKPQPDEFVTADGRLRPPRYPEVAAMSGVSGTVYVIVRIGRDGKVEDALAEQVNLRVVDSESGMNRWRGMLADATLRTARQWRFLPPTKGEEVDATFWLARVPVDYTLPGDKDPGYGQWQAYIPGPRQSAPWLGAFDISLGADAVATGGISPLDGGPRLLTPLDGT